MEVHKLYDEMAKIWEKGNNDRLLSWATNLIKLHPSDIDVNYIFLEVLSGVHLDAKHDEEEILVNGLCSEIIRNKKKHSPLTVAKAYAYQGEIRYYQIDRQPNFDKASSILDTLSEDDKEVQLLRNFIEVYYPLNIRQYLFFKVDRRNMFLVD